MDLETIRLKLRELHDRAKRWEDVGELFGVSGQWISKIARGEKDPGSDLQNRMERFLSAESDTTESTELGETEKLSRWLHWLGDVAAAGLLPTIVHEKPKEAQPEDLEKLLSDLVQESRSERTPDGISKRTATD